MRAVIYLSLTGRNGLVATAKACAVRAACAWERLTAIPGIEPAFRHPFFNEFALKLPCPASELISRLLHEKVAVGFPVNRYFGGMDNVLLLAFTEKRTRAEIDRLADLIGRIF